MAESIVTFEDRTDENGGNKVNISITHDPRIDNPFKDAKSFTAARKTGRALIYI